MQWSNTAFGVFLVMGAAGIARAIAMTGFGMLRRRSKCTPPSAYTILIAAHNEERVLGSTLDAVMQEHASEIIVVDDGSTDSTAQIVAERAQHHANIMLVRQENAGKAAALNRGLALASNDIAVCIDADTRPLPGSLIALASRLRDPRMGAVAGCYLVGNRNGVMPLWQELDYHIVRAERRGFDALGAQHVISGCFCAVRKTAVLGCGGFSGETIAEDFDLTITLQRAGWVMGYAPEATALLEVPHTLREWLKQRRRWVHGALEVCWKHRSALGKGVVGWVVLPHVWLQRVLLPPFLPIMDVWFLWSLWSGAHWQATLAVSLVYHGSEWLGALAEHALQPIPGNGRLLAAFPLYRMTHRWLLSWTNLRQSIVMLFGGTEAWHRVTRRGSTVAAHGFTAHPPAPNPR